ncbi:Protein of Unknown Function (DUF239 [Striga hermonthica]|uniref:Neprosin PEP catalytic domain-containing protein n=1 Tax=Striga hermonthica TaxID=68872 RepID=A0A9N7RAK2_STRHE|nr:Protein of Unknown Function (DUF239 [Striga hermonthica]
MPKATKFDGANTTNKSIDGRNRLWQMWHLTGRSCPDGTVPVRRVTVHDVLRAKSLYHFGKKQAIRSNFSTEGNSHEYAVAFASPQEGTYGAKAGINLWDPTVESPEEFSLSQIWVVAGSFDSDLNSVEAGWQVDPKLYGDNRPRLFTYWTKDAYQSTGCYNLLCPGFVQVDKKILVGAAISPCSTMGGSQYEVVISIFKDIKDGNWWLAVGDTPVGYWPSTLFTHLSDRATMVEWGGEIVNKRANNQHTSTQMGSGHFAEDGFRKASYFRNLQIVDEDNNLGSAQSVATRAESPNCYNIKTFANNNWGTYFYYGGPGRSPQCP